jgi:hypothetical protein
MRRGRKVSKMKKKKGGDETMTVPTTRVTVTGLAQMSWKAGLNVAAQYGPILAGHSGATWTPL